MITASIVLVMRIYAEGEMKSRLRVTVITTDTVQYVTYDFLSRRRR